MPADAPDSPERSAAEQAPVSSAAAAGEVVVAVEQPTTPVNGFAAEPEPPLADNPEVVVGAALIGGFLLGKLVKRLGS